MAVFRDRLVALGLALAALSLFACTQKSPEERIADIRSQYAVEVNQSGFVATPRLPPVPDSVEGMDGEAAGEGEDPVTDEESMEEEMAAAMAAELQEPEGYDILLDLILSTSSRELLPQVTVDIVHLDPSEQEKARWPVTMDTSGLLRGPGIQVTQKLENVDYEEGDIFYAEIRANVPAADRGSYPEFSLVP